MLTTLESGTSANGRRWFLLNASTSPDQSGSLISRRDASQLTRVCFTHPDVTSISAGMGTCLPRLRSGTVLRNAHEQARLALRVLQDGTARAVSLA